MSVNVSAGQELIGCRVEAVRTTEPGLTIADATRAGEGVRLLVAPLGDAAAGLDPARLMSDQDRYRIGAGGVARSLATGLVELPSGERALAIAYERPAGRTWTDAASGGLSRVHVAELGRRLARAIAPLHDQGIAHGLLRPDLVAVSEPNVWVLGFGCEPTLRAFVGGSSASRTMPADSLAPELRGGAGGSPTLASDVFAFSSLMKLLIGPLESDEVTPLLAKGLAQSPLERPQDLLRFADELGRAIEKEPVPAVIEAPPAAAAPPPAAPEVEAAPPAAEPEPAPAPAPAPHQPPRAYPPPIAPPPPSTRSKSSAAIWIMASIAGVLLILAGVFGLFVFALFRTAPTPAPPPTVVATADASAPLVEEPDAGAPLVESPDGGALADDDAGAPSFGDGGAPFADRDGGIAAVTPKLRANAPIEGIVPLPITTDVPTWGGKKPLVTLVWFGDLECPHTRRAYSVLLALERAFGDELRIAFRHRPLSTHTRARGAARVLAGVRREKGDLMFRSFLSSISASNDPPTNEKLEGWLEDIGGDRTRVAHWLAQRETDIEVTRDLTIAGLYDVRETPTFFVNGVRVEGNRPFDELKPIVDKELSAARGLMNLGTALEDIYAARVRKNMLGLGADVVSRSCPPIAGSPARGPNDALVTIVEYSDFECPFCKRVQGALQTVLARHGGDVRLVWKNFPLEFHPRARAAATFAIEVEKRGGPAKFWKVHDRLFAAQSNLDDAQFTSIAGEVGLDAETLLDAVHRRSQDASIDADMKLGKQLGVRGTPTFFINGRLLTGAQPAEKFEALVQEEIDNARRMLGGGTPRSRVYDAVCGTR